SRDGSSRPRAAPSFTTWARGSATARSPTSRPTPPRRRRAPPARSAGPSPTLTARVPARRRCASTCWTTPALASWPSTRRPPRPSAGRRSAGVQLLDAPAHLLGRHVLDVGGQRPDVAKGIGEGAAAVAVELVL